MADRPFAARVFADEANRRREDAAPSLACLDGARGERAAVADPFHVEQDRDAPGPSQDEVAVARVRVEVVGDRLLRRGKALRNDGSAVDASCAGRHPGPAGVCEDVLGFGSTDHSKRGYGAQAKPRGGGNTYGPQDSNLGHLQDIFDRGLVRIRRRRPQQR